MRGFEAHAAELLAAGVPVVLAGDYNVVPEERDIYPTTSYDGNALIQPESRAAYRAAPGAGMDRCDPGGASRGAGLYLLGLPADALGAGRGDAARPLPPEPGAGRAARGAGVDREVRGRENASDHAPVWIELGAARRRR